jgi:hypothetical protein
MLSLLWYLTTFCAVLVLLRLTWSRLWAPHWYAFGAMLAVSVARDILLRAVPFHSSAYVRWWMATLPLSLAAATAAALTLCRVISRQYPRIGRFGFWLFVCSIAIAAIVALIVTRPHIAFSLRSMVLLDRVVRCTLAGGMAIACIFLAVFPSPARHVPTNLRVHAWLYASYSLTYVLGYWLLAFVPAQAVNLGVSTAVAGCYLVWAFSLRAAGEAVEPWPEPSQELGELLRDRNRIAVKAVERGIGTGA